MDILIPALDWGGVAAVLAVFFSQLRRRVPLYECCWDAAWMSLGMGVLRTVMSTLLLVKDSESVEFSTKLRDQFPGLSAWARQVGLLELRGVFFFAVAALLAITGVVLYFTRPLRPTTFS